MNTAEKSSKTRTDSPDAKDPLNLYDEVFHARLLIGSAMYPSPDVMRRAIVASGAELVTVSLRRENAGGSGAAFINILKNAAVNFLPNTAGCHTVKEAVTTAQMGRELFGVSRVKLEVIGRSGCLNPDLFALTEAARILIEDGFRVYPYVTDDLSACEKLMNVGCRVLMPWAAPIGTGKGPINPYALKMLREEFPDTPLIADAGIGAPSHAARLAELGFDGILLNTAIAKAGDPVLMAKAFRNAFDAGRDGYHAGLMPESDLAAPSTPEFGTPFSPFS